MSAFMERTEVAAWLSRRENYPHRPAGVETLETHISQIFLADRLVFKLKKPVRFDFLDFTTVALRERACRDELRLNRRLAPHAYLDVLPMYRRNGELSWEAPGEIVDWVVQMERLPIEHTLENLFRRGAVAPNHIDRLAETLTAFYARLPAEEITGAEYRRRTREHLQGNRRELMQSVPELSAETIQRIHNRQLEYLLFHQDVFDLRVASGRLVEGHGDLRPEHICLTDPPVIFDCVEFNREFRLVDMVDELAFLAAECDHLGAPWVGERLLDRYREQTHDRPPAALIAFYKSYRACVRAKVAALRGRQVAGAAQAEEIRQATRYLNLADHYLGGGREPLLLIVGGLSGTGKSTLASSWSEASGAEWLRTDVIRTELFGANTAESAVDTGDYRPERRAAVYDAMLARARTILKKGISVVLDGTFADPQALHAARSLASRLPCRFAAVRCECPADMARARIEARRQWGRDVSRATLEVFDRQLQTQPLSAEEVEIVIDTQQPPEHGLERIAERLARVRRLEAN